MLNDPRYHALIDLRDNHRLLTTTANNIELQTAVADKRLNQWPPHVIADNWCQAFDEIRDRRYYSATWSALLMLIARSACIPALYDPSVVPYEDLSRKRIESFGFKTNTLCDSVC